MNGTSFTAGKVGQAFSFDGVDDFMKANSSNCDDLQQLTIEMWVALNSMPNGIMGRFITLPNESAMLCYTGNVGDFEFLMNINNSLHHIWLNIQTGDFHHIAGTYDGSFMRLYYDGVEVGNLAISGMFATGAGEDILLSWDKEPLDGILDEVSIYDRVLTPTEINVIYTAGSSGKCKPPDSFKL